MELLALAYPNKAKLFDGAGGIGEVGAEEV
jgi:hypothetical protein